jgi:hypothetical protein
MDSFTDALRDQVTGMNAGKWMGDQIMLTTSSILNRGFCTLPKDHGAWDFPYITIDRNNNALASIDDSLTWQYNSL